MDGQDLKFEPVILHKEDIGDQEYINNATDFAIEDIKFIDTKAIEFANKFKLLQDKTKTRINDIRRKIDITKDIQQDINILCNRYSNFSSIININETNSKSTLLWENGVISLMPTSSIKNEIKVISIDGNGYEGNKHVLVNDSFIDTVINTKSYDNITDNAINTSFEYSRITSNDSGVPPLFNNDSIDAECSIEIDATNAINKINISSDRKDLVLKEILLSDDGIIYKKYKDYNIKINDRDEKYENQNYIFSSGLVAIRPSRFIKMIFQSDGITNETIAYVKGFADEESEKVTEKIVLAKKSKRHVIKINDISAYRNKYSRGSLITDNIIDDPVTCVSLLSNEYMQEEYTAKGCISYFLIVNGIEYEVTPLNSHAEGIKMIKKSTNNYNENSIVSISEDIKNVKLKIVLDSPNVNVTPYLSDVKILIGKE